MRSYFAVALVPWLFACSSGSSTDGGDGGASNPDGSIVDGSDRDSTEHDASDASTEATTLDGPQGQDAPFAMTATVSITCSPAGEALASCTGGVEVTVEALTDGGARTANDVTVTANGMAVPSTGSNGEYVLHGLTGLAPSYEIVVSYMERSISTTFPSPSDFSVTLSPNPPAENTAATITYTPTGEANVGSSVIVTQATMTYDMVDPSDQGQFALPASAFPATGSYVVAVSRQLIPPVQMHRCDQCAAGGVVLTRELMTTVP
jgi:hypothetical protein